MADFALLESPKLISRKIGETEKSADFYVKPILENLDVVKVPFFCHFTYLEKVQKFIEKKYQNSVLKWHILQF